MTSSIRTLEHSRVVAAVVCHARQRSGRPVVDAKVVFGRWMLVMESGIWLTYQHVMDSAPRRSI